MSVNEGMCKAGMTLNLLNTMPTHVYTRQQRKSYVFHVPNQTYSWNSVIPHKEVDFNGM